MEAEATTKFDAFKAERPEAVHKIAHSGLELLGEKKMNFDHHLCNELIGYEEFPGERGLRPSHVNYLVNCMLRGTFHPEWVKLIVCQHEGSIWRMNGQHTCLARLELPKQWKEQGQVAVMTYEATTMEAMRELYASIDRNAARTKGNVINSYLGGTEQFEGCSAATIRLLGNGIGFWLWEGGHEQAKHDGDEVSYLMTHHHKELVTTLMNFCLEEPRVVSLDFLRRSAVIAAMYETFSKVVQPSADFWNAVKSGVGFESADDPRLRLRTALQDSKLNASKAKSRSQGIDQETMYRWCVNAFNRWRRGEQAKNVVSTKERQRAR